MGHEYYAQCKFYVYVSTDVTADAASCWTLAAFILTLEKSQPKIEMHIKHCLSSATAIPIQEAQKLHCVDAAASDSENRCEWCLASLVDIFWEFLFRILWNDSARRVQYAKHVLFSHSTVEKEFFFLFMSSKSFANRECWSRFVVIGYWTDNLKAKNHSAIHFLRKWFVFGFLLPSRIVGARLYVVMTSWQVECVVNKN